MAGQKWGVFLKRTRKSPAFLQGLQERDVKKAFNKKRATPLSF